MIKIQLKRSGGMLGKSLQASGSFDIEEAMVIKQLAEMTVTKNPEMRDGFSYSISINGGSFLPIDPAQIKGPLKKILSGLEDELVAG